MKRNLQNGWDFSDALLEAYFDQEIDSKYDAELKQLETEIAAMDAQVKQIETALQMVPTVEARIETEHPELFAQFKEFSNKRKALADEIQSAKANLRRLNSYSASEWDPQGTVGGAQSRNELRSTYETRIADAEQALKEFEETNTEMMSLLDEYTKKYQDDVTRNNDDRKAAIEKSWAVNSARSHAVTDRHASRIAAASDRTVESLDDLNAFLKDWASIFNADKYYRDWDGGNLDAAGVELEGALRHAQFCISTEYISDYWPIDDDKQYLELHFEDEDLTSTLYWESQSLPDPLILDSNLTYKQVIVFLDAVVDILGNYFYGEHRTDDFWYY